LRQDATLDNVCWRYGVCNNGIRETVETTVPLCSCGPDKPKEIETVRTYQHDERSLSVTTEDSDVGNGGRRLTMWKTGKKMVR